MNKKLVATKALKLGGKILKHTAVLSLSVLGLAMPNKEEEHEPTLEESMRGEKLPFTGEYFIPTKDSHK